MGRSRPTTGFHKPKASKSHRAYSGWPHCLLRASTPSTWSRYGSFRTCRVAIDHEPVTLDTSVTKFEVLGIAFIDNFRRVNGCIRPLHLIRACGYREPTWAAENIWKCHRNPLVFWEQIFPIPRLARSTASIPDACSSERSTYQFTNAAIALR